MNRKHVLAVGIAISSIVGVVALVPANAAPPAQAAVSDGPLSGLLGRCPQDVKVTNTPSVTLSGTPTV